MLLQFTPVFVVRHAKRDLYLAHVKEIRGAFDQGHSLVSSLLAASRLMLDSFTIVVVVMTAKDKVHAWHLSCKPFVIVHVHVAQCDDHITSILLSKPPGILCGASLVVLVKDVDLQVEKALNPFALADANEADLATCFVEDDFARAAANAIWAVLGPIFGHEVGRDPLALATLGRHGLLEDFVHLGNVEVKLVISYAGNLYTAELDCVHHLLALKHRA